MDSWRSHQLNCHCFFFKDVKVKSENVSSEVVITKEMEEEEKQLEEEGERKEKEMMEKVCCLFVCIMSVCPSLAPVQRSLSHWCVIILQRLPQGPGVVGEGF